MAQFVVDQLCHKPDAHYLIHIGSYSDIGGGKENQDDYLIWKNEDHGIHIIGILDGHGREVGKIAASAAKASLLSYFDEHFMRAFTQPKEFLVDAHHLAHMKIKEAFIVSLTEQGYMVKEESTGFLVKRKSTMEAWRCVHGGTACSLCLLYNGKLFVANVGDSNGIVCSSKHVLHDAYVEYLGDAAWENTSELKKMRMNSHNSHNCVIQITADHSPESLSEFYRMRDFRRSDRNPDFPAVLTVYDQPNTLKVKCPPVFEKTADGVIKITKKGRYYKNVRKEWASLVSTPVDARYNDSLAFTRSLGDLHLHTYGVTHLPEIHFLDISSIFDEIATKDVIENPATKDPETVDMLCLVLASDGVWDNFVYSDVASYLMSPSSVATVRGSLIGAQSVAEAFMDLNAQKSKQNFGAQADNATCVLVYIQKKVVENEGPGF